MGVEPDSGPGEPDEDQQDDIDLGLPPEKSRGAWGRAPRIGGRITAMLLMLMAISPMRYQRAYLIMLVLVVTATATAWVRGRRRRPL